MTALTWTDALALQQPRMDDTHREFVDLLNGVGAALDAESAVLTQALDAFVQHTVEHFAQEDLWMRHIGFAAESCHSVQHAQVLELVREVRRRLVEQADVDVVRALVPALAEWFPIHAQTMDAGLALSMDEVGYDTETGVMARPPEPAAPVQSGCGSTSCG